MAVGPIIGLAYHFFTPGPKYMTFVGSAVVGYLWSLLGMALGLLAVIAFDGPLDEVFSVDGYFNYLSLITGTFGVIGAFCGIKLTNSALKRLNNRFERSKNR